MRVCAIAGGVGSARFCAGLVRVIDPRELTIVVNTGDDESIRGLLVCPDIDTVLYHLSGATEWDRGWGLHGESFVADERYKELAARAGLASTDLQEWFALGDRDLATHMIRARLLDTGHTLAEATAVLARAQGISASVVPVTNDVLRTVLTIASGVQVDFQEYFVRHRQADEVTAVAYTGAGEATAAPGVVDSIASADVVVIPPSNPVLSIGPLLAVPGVREAIERAPGIRVGVSPIVGGRALKGPADKILASLGHEVSPVGVARMYQGLVGAFVLDAVDAMLASTVASLGMRAVVCDTIMSGPEEAARVAKDVLDHVRGG